MGSKFLININCSLFISNPEATVYTMFVDSSKMSIVYELVEWIRWMFSLKYCIYLMHGKSVIHELEDIQLLSELKDFDIVPCGQQFCVHKKMYRRLLENLNLFDSWKDMKVHRYFLDKINQMNEKLTPESIKAQDHQTDTTAQNLITFNTDSDNNKKNNTDENNSLLNKKQHLENKSMDSPVAKKIKVTDNGTGRFGESPVRVTSYFNQKITEKGDVSIRQDDTLGLSSSSENKEKHLETKKDTNESPNKRPVNSTKKHKTVKPFSMGEILSLLRKDLGEKILESTPNENASETNALITKEDNSQSNIVDLENSFTVQDEITDVRKRQRTRKRKRKKQLPENKAFTLHETESKTFLPSNMATINGNSRPHHIRFDVDDEDNFKKSECAEGPIESEHEDNIEDINITPAYLNNQSKEFLIDIDQNSSEKNDVHKSGCLYAADNEMTREEKAINEQLDSCEKANRSSNSLENFELNNSDHDFSGLWSLKAKYKNGVVIQRF